MDEEMLDVVDDRGRHVGVKPRDAVHRDGDWHVAFHLWVVSRDGVLLQRRARAKASWPGRLDATAAGHLLAGETVRDGLREVQEELGVTYAFDDLQPLGVHRVQDSERSEVVNREHQHVFAIRDDRALSAWTRFDHAELDALVLVGHDGFATLAAGDPRAVQGRSWDGRREQVVSVHAVELVPTPYLAEMGARLAVLGDAPAGRVQPGTQ